MVLLVISETREAEDWIPGNSSNSTSNRGDESSMMRTGSGHYRQVFVVEESPQQTQQVAEKHRPPTTVDGKQQDECSIIVETANDDSSWKNDPDSFRTTRVMETNDPAAVVEDTTRTNANATTSTATGTVTTIRLSAAKTAPTLLAYRQREARRAWEELDQSESHSNNHKDQSELDEWDVGESWPEETEITAHKELWQGFSDSLTNLVARSMDIKPHHPATRRRASLNTYTPSSREDPQPPNSSPRVTHRRNSLSSPLSPRKEVASQRHPFSQGIDSPRHRLRKKKKTLIVTTGVNGGNGLSMNNNPAARRRIRNERGIPRSRDAVPSHDSSHPIPAAAAAATTTNHTSIRPKTLAMMTPEVSSPRQRSHRASLLATDFPTCDLDCEPMHSPRRADRSDIQSRRASLSHVMPVTESTSPIRYPRRNSIHGQTYPRDQPKHLSIPAAATLNPRRFVTNHRTPPCSPGSPTRSTRGRKYIGLTPLTDLPFGVHDQEDMDGAVVPPKSPVKDMIKSPRTLSSFLPKSPSIHAMKRDPTTKSMIPVDGNRLSGQHHIHPTLHSPKSTMGRLRGKVGPEATTAATTAPTTTNTNSLARMMNRRFSTSSTAGSVSPRGERDDASSTWSWMDRLTNVYQRKNTSPGGSNSSSSNKNNSSSKIPIITTSGSRKTTTSTSMPRRGSCYY